MINKSFGTDWVFGSNCWVIEDGFVVDQQTGNVLDIAGGARKRNPVILYPKHGGAHQKWEFVPIDDWMILKNPGSGLCLHVSKNLRQELTVEEQLGI